MTEMRCDTCTYWVRSYLQRRQQGTCHHRSPMAMPNAVRQSSEAAALLLWWLVREIADEETANREEANYSIDPEMDEPFEAHWPITLNEDWCGDWKEKQ